MADDSRGEGDSSTKLVRYTPLRGIVEGQPQERAVSVQDFFRSEQDGDLGDLEATLFDERLTGDFLVFPPSVLGVDRVYRIAPCYEAIIIIENSPLGSQMASGYFILKLPDQAKMEELKFTLPEDQYLKLKAYYQSLGRGEGVHLRLTKTTTIASDRGRYPKEIGKDFSLKNQSDPAIAVYHNGARLMKGSCVYGSNKDIIRIGPSIVMAYYHKEASQDLPTDTGSSSALVPSGGTGITRR